MILCNKKHSNFLQTKEKIDVVLSTVADLDQSIVLGYMIESLTLNVYNDMLLDNQLSLLKSDGMK